MGQVKMRSLGWALVQYGWCPYTKEKFGDTHTGRAPCEREDGHRQAKESRTVSGCLLLKPPILWHFVTVAPGTISVPLFPRVIWELGVVASLPQPCGRLLRSLEFREGRRPSHLGPSSNKPISHILVWPHQALSVEPRQPSPLILEAT